MKVLMKMVEEITYEVEVTPEEYCAIRTSGSYTNLIVDRAVTAGKIYDLSRTYKGIRPKGVMDVKELDDFLG